MSDDNTIRIKIETGEALFNVLRSTEILEKLVEDLRVELSGRAVAEYLRVCAEAIDCEDEDEARVLRDAADIVEEGWGRV